VQSLCLKSYNLGRRHSRDWSPGSLNRCGACEVVARRGAFICQTAMFRECIDFLGLVTPRPMGW
jgi:hypothetical protein